MATNAGLARKASSVFGRCAADPPDRRYTTIARPVRRLVPKIDLPGQADETDQALHAALVNQSQAFELVRVFVDSLERAQGAAVADDAHWAERQTLAAASYAADAANALERDVRLRRKAARALNAATLPTVSVDAADVRAYQRRVRDEGLPWALRSALEQQGLGRADMDALRSAILAVDPDTVTGPVDLARAVRPLDARRSDNLAKSLRRFARRARRQPLSPV
jgi:hypothetical protein